MNDKIKAYLTELEKEHGIEILLACETGSRAWGFPSPDSDYDVRIIYKHPKDWYLSLEEQKDTIETSILPDGIFEKVFSCFVNQMQHYWSVSNHRSFTKLTKPFWMEC
jgi:predicted nucleotidyltransferase